MSTLIVDGVKYKLWTPKDEEKEFHPLVRKCYKEIFGEDSIYFDVKHVLKAASGIGSIPDAYVINLSKSELYVVENELASHPVYDHIVKQLTKFINGLENPDARNQIIDMLYDEIGKDDVLRVTVEKAIGSKDVYRFISKLLSKPPRIVIVVDQKTPEIEEACKVLKYQPDIVEFQTFVRENVPNVQAHLFEPLYVAEKVLRVEKKEEEKRRLPEHYESWEKMLAWVDETTRDIVKVLTACIQELPKVTPKVIGRWYSFNKGEPSSKSRFVVLKLSKKKVGVRIRAEPTTFKDPKNGLETKYTKDGSSIMDGDKKENSR